MVVYVHPNKEEIRNKQSRRRVKHKTKQNTKYKKKPKGNKNKTNQNKHALTAQAEPRWNKVCAICRYNQSYDMSS